MNNHKRSFLKDYLTPGLAERVLAEKDNDRYIIFDALYLDEAIRETEGTRKMRGDFSVITQLCQEASIPYQVHYVRNTSSDPANFLCSSLLDCVAYVKSREAFLRANNKLINVLLFTRGYNAFDGNIINVLLALRELPVSITVNLYNAYYFPNSKNGTLEWCVGDLQYSTWKAKDFMDEWIGPSFRILLPWEVFNYPHDVAGWKQYVDSFLLKGRIGDEEQDTEGSSSMLEAKITYGHPLHILAQLGADLPFFHQRELHKTVEEWKKRIELISGKKLFQEALLKTEIWKHKPAKQIREMMKIVNENLRQTIQPDYSHKETLKPWFQIVGSDEEEEETKEMDEKKGGVNEQVSLETHQTSTSCCCKSSCTVC